MSGYMDKNPFSLKDFLAYVFPGALALFIVYSVYVYNSNGDGTFMLSLINAPIKLDAVLLILLLSYVTGHFIAYFSSLTIENYLIWLYGYPSDFLLKDVPDHKYFKVHEPASFLKKSWRVVVALMLLPITLSTLLIAKLFKADYFLTKKLDPVMIVAIQNSCRRLAAHLDYPCSELDETDFHRIVSHYEYEMLPFHSQKMDNYISLYGFLRSIALIFNFTFLYILVFVAIPSVDFDSHIDWNMIILLVALALITYIFFLGFMKFYRRYTLENLMCAVIDVSYKQQTKNN